MNPVLLALRRGLVYEIDLNYGRAVHPIPTLTNATCPTIPILRSFNNHPGLLFREDSFDAVSRVRRGRMYVLDDRQGARDLLPQNIHNYPFGEHVGAAAGWQPDVCYRQLVVGDIKTEARLEGAQIDLGEMRFKTSWRIVALERISTGEFLFTLRVMSTLGTLPPLADNLFGFDQQPIDALRTEQVRQALERFADAFHVQQPQPIVDTGRETLKIILTAWIGAAAEARDLRDVLKLVRDGYDIAERAAWIVNRLHSRGKSSEQERQATKGKPLRTVTGEDAEASAHLVGLVLREIGWAKS